MQLRQTLRTSKQKLTDAVSATRVFATINDMCYGPLMRSHYSPQTFGPMTTLAGLMILLSAAVASSEAIFGYFFVWLVAVVLQGLRSHHREKNERFPYFTLSGWPWLAMKIAPWVTREDMARQYIEPAMCFLVGCLLCLLSKGLGVFFIMGAISLAFKAAMDRRTGGRGGAAVAA